MPGGSRRAGMRAGMRTGGDGARLSDAHPNDQLFVASLRRWLDGPCGQAEVWNGLASSRGAGRASALLKAFEALLRAIAVPAAVSAGRRLQRHGTHCPCLGEDEALLAGMVRAAGRGDTESARAMAAGIARESDLLVVVEAAARLGQLMDNIGADPVSGAEARTRLH